MWWEMQTGEKREVEEQEREEQEEQEQTMRFRSTAVIIQWAISVLQRLLIVLDLLSCSLLRLGFGLGSAASSVLKIAYFIQLGMFQ